MIVNLKNRTSDFFERTNTLVRYYEDIRKYKMLTNDEEVKCFKIISCGNEKEAKEAKDAIVNSNQRFVVAIAKKFANNDNILDLISEGNVGLMEAVEKFDYTKGVKFITFAVYYIRRAINRFLIDNGNLVTKTNYQKTYHFISQATNKFLQVNHRKPTLDELKEMLCNEYNVSIKDTVDIIDTRFVSIDLDTNDEDECIGMSDFVEFQNKSAKYNDYDETVNKEHIQELVTSMLNHLDKREQDIIKLAFGIDCDRPYEIQEIADKIGLTKERVRQIKSEVLHELKNNYSKILNIL